ncbi:MAG: guanylate kinase [Campylobacteraceae bacterium]|nr:guanylate kinase [Campylobacteraceae bacterium]
MKNKGALLVISGPSGAGKSSIIKELLKQIPNAVFSISTTTRNKREDEVDGVNYHFTDEKSFQKEIEEGAFLEWANVHGCFYGTSLKQIVKFLDEEKLVILDIDVQGYMLLKKRLKRYITSVFLTTKNIEELKARLLLRQSDSKTEVKKRLKNAIAEMNYINRYKYLVINDDFKTAFAQMLNIAHSALNKRSLIDSDKFIQTWKRAKKAK